MLEHSKGLDKIIQKRISQGYNYLQTLRTMYGADPREVWDVFKKFKQEHIKKIGFTNSYPQFPEPHPAYSQWRITTKSADIILEKLIEKDYEKVCFLGCPILGIEFEDKCSKKSVLLDIDKTTINYAKKFTDAIEYDINEDVPEELKNRFECVIIDPPWYNDDIKLFLKRALELAKIGGTVYGSLPGLLTKPSILKERLNLQKLLTDSKVIIAELSPIVEYEVPAFEYMAYKDIPAFSGKNWRTGDWFKLKKLEDLDIQFPSKKEIKWIEYRYNEKRIFLKDGKENWGQEPELNSLYLDDSFILKTVSKRNPLIPKIDIWTSRNAVLHINSGYPIIYKILGNINKKDEDIIKEIYDLYGKYKSEIKDSLKKIRELIEV